jgi:hypothetical protein
MGPYLSTIADTAAYKRLYGPDMPGDRFGPEPDANRYAARPLGRGDWCVWDYAAE